MNTSKSSQLGDLYIIFSKSFFVPEIQDDRAAYSEPFRSSIETFLDAINDNKTNLPSYLSSGNTPFWKKRPFIPGIGELAFNHKKNVVSRLLISCTRSRMSLPTGKTYLDSGEFDSIPHLPFLITFKKKIRSVPTVTQYLRERRSRKSIGSGTSDTLPTSASQSHRTYIHFYPYGLFVINVAISIVCATAIYTDEIIEWLRRIKSSRVRREKQVDFVIGDSFRGNLASLFEYIWSTVARSVLAEGAITTLASPVYDSIRIKPISRLDADLIKRAKDELSSAEDDWEDKDESSGVESVENDWEDWEDWEDWVNWIQYAQKLLESHERELTIEDYKSLGIQPSVQHSYLDDEERYRMGFYEYACEFCEWLKNNWDTILPGDLEQQYSLYLSFRHLLRRPPEIDREIYEDFLLPYLHKKLKDNILQSIRKIFPITLQQSEIAGLLSKSAKWKTLDTKSAQYRSVFGRLCGDLIVPRSQSMLIVHSAWPLRKQLTLLFHWRLQAVHELVCAQRLILPYYTKLMRTEVDRRIRFSPETDKRGGTRDVVGSKLQGPTLRFLTGLTRLQEHLPRHLRRWYSQLADAMGIARIQKEFQRSFDAYGQIGLRDVQRSSPEHPESAIPSLISILFLAAEPSDTSRLRLGEEFREIQEKLQLAKQRERFELHIRMSVRPADISQALLDVQPQIIHFSGHGTATGALCFENQVGETHPIQPDALAALFEQFADQVNCVILNACYTEPQANAIAQHIDYVIGMNQAIGDKAAIAFAIGFYQALGAGRTAEEAYKLGCVQIGLQNIPEHLTPVMVKKRQVQP